MVATLYVDLMSQPSRACVIFCRLNDLPVTIQNVFIHKGELRSQEYLAINPLGKVPFLVDQEAGLKLPESAAIMAYLAAQHPGLVQEHWLPRLDAAARARVEAGMHWYHSTVRLGAMRISWNKVVAARLGMVGDEALAKDGLKVLKMALAALQSYWLDGGRQPFMGGSAVSIADLLCCCELEQLTMLDRERHGFDLEQILDPYPEVRAWRARVQRACRPAWDDVHTTLRRAAAAKAGPAGAVGATPLAAKL